MNRAALTWCTLCLAGAALAGTLGTVRGKAPAYPSERRRVYERPSFQLDSGDVVEILRRGEALVQVRSRTGRTGWVPANLVDTTIRPALLSVTPSKVQSQPLTPSEDSALAKRWIEAHKDGEPVDSTPGPAPEKPLVFPDSQGDISPRHSSDSLLQ